MQKELRKFWNKENYKLSCSETMLYAGNEFYHLGLDEKAFKMMSGFSGGMFEGETCGVVTGGVAVLSLLFTVDNKENSPKLKPAIVEFKQRFKTELKSQDCTPLKVMYEEEGTGCGNLIYAGGKILEEVITKHLKA
ncbi:MAG: C_GCAxxG_C_C family protein [Tenericutes bacterium]|nr:C_GCAxxG_C_C family protein [Mycoplasmatota bacterium]